MARYLWGPLSAFGLVIAVVVCAADQALKVWLVQVYDLGRRGVVELMPFVDLVLAWNKGISFSMFTQDTAAGRWALLAIKLVAVVFLWLWLARVTNRLAAVSLGLIVGGAIGNAIDRLAYGAVVDFVLLYAATATWRFDWYVFNLADVAVVAGVIGLLYESFLVGDGAAKAP